MPAIRIDLPHMSTIEVYVPYAEVPRTKGLLKEMIDHPWSITHSHDISVHGSGFPSLAAKKQAELLDKTGNGELETRAYIGLADRLHNTAWSIMFFNSKGRIEAWKAARGETWELNKVLIQLKHYIHGRLDPSQPEATLYPTMEEKDGI